MAISMERHNAVIVIDGNYKSAIGCSSFSLAIKLIEDQVPTEEIPNAIEDAMSASGVDIEGTNFKVMETESYLDVIESDEDDE